MSNDLNFKAHTHTKKNYTLEKENETEQIWSDRGAKRVNTTH